METTLTCKCGSPWLYAANARQVLFPRPLRQCDETAIMEIVFCALHLSILCLLFHFHLKQGHAVHSAVDMSGGTHAA